MHVIASPFGALAFQWNPDALGITAHGEQIRGALTHLDIRSRNAKTDAPRNVASTHLRRWLDGDIDALLDIPVLQEGTAFRQEVWAAMRLIPSGTVASYAELAAQTSSPAAVRATASTCATNQIPIVVPCHRVVRSDGFVGNYAMGSHVKISLLEHEGVEIF